jgi:chemotaxis protein CheX
MQYSVAFDPNWRPILECAALEVFEIMAGVRPEVSASAGEVPRGELTAMVGLAGALCGMTTIRCSRAMAAIFASLMIGGDAASNLSNAQDALGELCNMVAGNFKGKISALSDHCMLSVPTVITGEDYSMSTLEPSEGFTIALTVDGEPIWLAMIIHS